MPPGLHERKTYWKTCHWILCLNDIPMQLFQRGSISSRFVPNYHVAVARINCNWFFSIQLSKNNTGFYFPCPSQMSVYTSIRSDNAILRGSSYERSALCFISPRTNILRSAGVGFGGRVSTVRRFHSSLAWSQVSRPQFLNFVFSPDGGNEDGRMASNPSSSLCTCLSPMS